MKCPKCSAGMEKVVFEEVEVDRCVACGGIWFDAGEREQLSEMKGSEAIEAPKPAKGKKPKDALKVDCPVCGKRMAHRVDLSRIHLGYESCASCNGVFLDAGEFGDYKKGTLFDFFHGLFTHKRT